MGTESTKSGAEKIAATPPINLNSSPSEMEKAEKEGKQKQQAETAGDKEQEESSKKADSIADGLAGAQPPAEKTTVSDAKNPDVKSSNKKNSAENPNHLSSGTLAALDSIKRIGEILAELFGFDKAAHDDVSPDDDSDYEFYDNFRTGLQTPAKFIRVKHSQMAELYGDSPEAVGAELESVNFCGKNVQIHKKIAPFLEWANRRITEEKIPYLVNSAGGFNWRNIADSHTLSNHSFGTAIDINPAENPISRSALITDLPNRFVEIMEESGFSWGGRWKSKKDPMHFEFVRNPRDATTLLSPNMPADLRQKAHQANGIDEPSPLVA